MSEIIYRILSVAFLTIVFSAILYIAYLGLLSYVGKKLGIDYFADEEDGDEV